MKSKRYYQKNNVRKQSRRKQDQPYVIGTLESQYYCGPFYEIYSNGRMKEKVRFGNGYIQDNGWV